jgi:hypothetical protein
MIDDFKGGFNLPRPAPASLFAQRSEAPPCGATCPAHAKMEALHCRKKQNGRGQISPILSTAQLLVSAELKRSRTRLSNFPLGAIQGRKFFRDNLCREILWRWLGNPRSNVAGSNLSFCLAFYCLRLSTHLSLGRLGDLEASKGEVHLCHLDFFPRSEQY